MTEPFQPGNFNPHDPAFLADPYPTYAQFREQAPIHRVEPYESSWVFRYEDCRQVLLDTDVWIKNPPGGSKPSAGPYSVMSSFPEGLFASDPPLHTELRDILEPLFAEAIVQAPKEAGKIAGPLLEAARRQGRMEMVSDYALPLPAKVLFKLLGIPEDERHVGVWNALIGWQAAIVAAHDITQSLGVRAAGATCSMALNTFFEGLLLEDESKSPARGSLFAQICRAFKKAGLSTQQVQVCACDILVAGYLSTTFVLCTGVRDLILHPDQQEKLRGNPSLVGPALEEMLRFEGPVQLIDRCAASETELGGQVFKPGEKISTVVGSANRDAGAFHEPDSFEIEREDTTHLAFGEGIHHCIGAPLVRLVAPVALEMLLAAFPELAIDGLAQWQTDPYLHAITSLPLRF